MDDPAVQVAAAGDPAALARAVDAVGADLYPHLAGPAAGMVFSPASIAMAIQMVLHGARGETAAELARFLHLSGAGAAAQALRQLTTALGSALGDAAATDGAATFRAPNTMWVQSGLPLEAEFTAGLRDIPALAVKAADFATAPRGAAAEINRVIAEQTAGKITGLIAPAQLDADTKLVLANAVYLKAPWAHPFPAGATRDEPFHLDEGEPVTVPMMHVTARFGYTRADGYQVAALPYANTRLAMAVLLPDGPLTPLEERLASAGLAALAGRPRPVQVALAMPRFRLSAGCPLALVLRQLGATTAFSRAADFTGITTAEPIRIGEVVHKAYIDVDETGTEAAAATAAIMMVSAALPGRPPVMMVVDRPFLFAIIDTATGIPLFLGRVTNPAAG